ncbi:MAG TPA: hypothetical protein VLA61_14495 [Ideonella sp.]|uniref:hypothetical protein n=1 Tax=Ideonella sp. TaxID=1929293 RepID=UPI002D08CF1D|nr:hypothetical protein [Ideonella sp.]HSI49480.1 hypothetical protein [Ideonella sp.]
MQRLFTGFPAGLPGLALLIMRVALSVLLLACVLRQPGWLGSGAASLAPWGVAIALWAGLFTPAISALCILCVLPMLLNQAGEWDAVGAVSACTILEAAALSLLGPGAYSLDAKLFGRRRIILAQHGGRDQI